MPLIRQALCATVAILTAGWSAATPVQTQEGVASGSPDAACQDSDMRPPFDFSKPVIVGEFHGTEQSGPMVIALVCSAITSGRSVSLAVEMSPQAIEDVFDGPVTNRFWQSQYPDGRASIAMRSMLRSLAHLRRSGAVNVLGFVDGEESDPSSDAAYADRIQRRVRPGDAVIVLVGSYHARRTANPLETDTLPSAFGDVVNVRIANSQPGAAWACTPECGVQALGGSTGHLPPGFSPVPAANGFDYFYVVERFTPSAPF